MKCKLSDMVLSTNTGADAIKRAPIVQEDTGVRCLRIGDVSQSRKYDDWGFTKVNEMDYQRYQLKKGDIIVARTGNTIGVNKFIEKDLLSVYNNGLIRIQVDENKIRPKYFYYIVRSKSCQDYIQSIAFGTSTQPNMKIKDFLRYEFEYFDLETQDKVISLIEPIEQKIFVNDEINNNLEQQAQAYFDELFIANVDSSWKEGCLADIGTIVAGGTPSKAKPEYYSENGIPWITPKDLSNNKSKFIYRGEIDISELGFSKSSATKMPEGTVLFSSRAPIGYIAIAANEVTTNQGFKSIIPNDDIGTAFTYFMLKHLLPIIENMASGSTFKEISGAGMKNIPLTIPDSKIIQKFNTFCKAIFEQQAILEKENNYLAVLRDNLLPRLMSGDLDISKIDI